jgi:hypothetical protein
MHRNRTKIHNPKSKMEMGGRRDSNPQQPEPQSGALPLSYDHHIIVEFRFLESLCKGKRLGRGTLSA